jgi:hypothetical protein
MSRFFQFGLWLILAVLLAAPLSAQIFKIEGGTSTLFNADGGTLSIKAPNYDGSFGAGIFEGHFLMGAVARTKVMGYTVTAGDDSVRFDLPTDIFGNTSYFAARGVGISKNSADSGFYILGGLTSEWTGTGFFQAARSQDPTGVIFFHHRITDTLHFYSRNVASTKSTSLQALEWDPEKWLKTSATGGIGSGKPYLATGIDAELRQLTLRASYAYVSPDFRRVTIPDLQDSEPERENLEATYHFNRDDSITAAHRNLMQPLSLNSPFERASSDQLSGNFRLGHTYFGAGLYSSRFSGENSWGTNIFVGQKIKFLDVNTSYFVSKSGTNQADSMLTNTFREIMSPRFSLLQVLTYTEGQWAFAYGGSFITNRFNVSLDYQTQYLAFRTNKPFQQTLSLNAMVHVIGPIALTANSSVAPDGHVRYSFGGETYLYRYNGLMPSWGQANESYKFPKYLVKGFVQDVNGKPVSGAAIQIGNDIVFTDGTGSFMYRTRKHSQMEFKVVVNQFLATGIFEVVQAPLSVTPEKEDQAQDVQVVVREYTPEQAATVKGLLAVFKESGHE